MPLRAIASARLGPTDDPARPKRPGLLGLASWDCPPDRSACRIVSRLPSRAIILPGGEPPPAAVRHRREANALRAAPAAGGG